MKKQIYIVLIFLVFFNQSFAQNYDLDKQLGAENAKEIPKAMGFYDDPVLLDWVTEVGQKLAGQVKDVPLDFTFHLVDAAEPNAFALPGGYIYFTRGILPLVNDESELAGIMAHEMIHAIERHSVKQMRKNILPGILQIPGAVVGVFNQNLGALINAPVAFGSALVLSSYSRKQEKQADKLGVELVASAGYDPAKLAQILERLQQDVETMTGEEEQKNYFSSHPYTPKRISYLNKEVEKLDYTPGGHIAKNKTELFGLLKGLCFGVNPKQGLFRDTRFLQPDADFTVTFPAGWHTQNIPVAVGAMQPDGAAQLVLQTMDTIVDPDVLGADFVKKFTGKYHQKPKEYKHLEINGNPAYMVLLNDISSGRSIDMIIYWIKMNNMLFTFSGMSYSSFTEVMKASAQSLRRLTKKEKESITWLKLDFAKAKNGETIGAFSKRTGNTWNDELTAVMNGIETGTVLKEGQLLKIVTEEPYFTNR